MTYKTVAATPQHAAGIDHLLNVSFGPGRQARAAERLRETNQPVTDYARICKDAIGALVGSISYWPVRIGTEVGEAGVLLGPLAVHPDARRAGIGQTLMRETLERVEPARFGFVLLVGDQPYYARVGFEVAPTSIEMPGPVDMNRLLIRSDPAVRTRLSGIVRPAPDLC